MILFHGNIALHGLGHKVLEHVPAILQVFLNPEPVQVVLEVLGGNAPKPPVHPFLDPVVRGVHVLYVVNPALYVLLYRGLQGMVFHVVVDGESLVADVGIAAQYDLSLLYTLTDGRIDVRLLDPPHGGHSKVQA